MASSFVTRPEAVSWECLIERPLLNAHALPVVHHPAQQVRSTVKRANPIVTDAKVYNMVQKIIYSPIAMLFKL